MNVQDFSIKSSHYVHMRQRDLLPKVLIRIRHPNGVYNTWHLSEQAGLETMSSTSKMQSSAIDKLQAERETRDEQKNLHASLIHSHYCKE